MAREAQTVRSTRTRAALRRAALSRFMSQGVEETSVEEIAADSGVTVRTFYRHFATKQDLLFADYDAGLHWFRSALAARGDDEPLIEAVQAAIFAFPQDITTAVYASSLYAARGQNTSVTSFSADNVFSDGEQYQLCTLTQNASTGAMTRR